MYIHVLLVIHIPVPSTVGYKVIYETGSIYS